MTTLLDIFDIILGLCLVVVAWRVLSSKDLFRAAVLFITFGVIMSIAWVRLRVPDLALVEVAIGAGLTGALLLNTLGAIEGEEQAAEAKRTSEKGAGEEMP